MAQHQFQVELTPNTDGRTQSQYFTTVVNCNTPYDGQKLLEAQYGTAQGKANIAWQGEVN
jgi:hypothetical protein